MVELANIYIEVENPNTQHKDRTWGYVLECEVKGVPYTKTYFGRATDTYHKATLVALGNALGRFRCPCEIHIYSTDRFVLAMLERNMSAWTETEFKSNTDELKHHDEWKTVWERGKDHLLIMEPGKHAFTSWLMSENERRAAVSNMTMAV